MEFSEKSQEIAGIFGGDGVWAAGPDHPLLAARGIRGGQEAWQAGDAAAQIAACAGWGGVGAEDLIFATWGVATWGGPQPVGIRLWSAGSGRRYAPASGSGCATTGAILASVPLLAAWQGKGEIDFIFVAEGEPDFLAACQIAAGDPDIRIGVAGVFAGAWSPQIGERIGALMGLGGEIIAGTDDDPAGDRYAAQIEESMRGRGISLGRWRRPKVGADLCDSGLLILAAEDAPAAARALLRASPMMPPDPPPPPPPPTTAPSPDDGGRDWRGPDIDRARAWVDAAAANFLASVRAGDFVGDRGEFLRRGAPLASYCAGGALDRASLRADLEAAIRQISQGGEQLADRLRLAADLLREGGKGRPRIPKTLADVAAELALRDGPTPPRARTRTRTQKPPVPPSTTKEGKEVLGGKEKEDFGEGSQPSPLPIETPIETPDPAPTSDLPSEVDLERSEAPAKISPSPSPPTGIWDRLFFKEGRHGSQICADLRNLEIIFRMDVGAGQIRQNKFAGRLEIFGSPAWGRGLPDATPLSDGLLAELHIWLLQRYQLEPTGGDLREAALLLGERAAYDPLSDYLSGLIWDGQPRLDGWLPDYCGAEDGALSRFVGPRWLIGAAQRGLQPGAKLDNVMVFEGLQGVGKSRAAAALCPDPSWFLDFGGDVGGRDAAEALQGKWIVELAELAVLARGRDARIIKGFLSRTTDCYRRPYGHFAEDFPRRSAFLATVNLEGEGYLSDPSGNRRWWPVRVGQRLDPDGIARDRDQLWAEAVARLRSGERYDDGQGAEILGAAQAERVCQDPWLAIICDWIDVEKPLRLQVSEVARSALGMEKSRIGAAEARRIATILRSLGWSRRLEGQDRRAVWVRPEASPN